MEVAVSAIAGGNTLSGGASYPQSYPRLPPDVNKPSRNALARFPYEDTDLSTRFGLLRTSLEGDLVARAESNHRHTDFQTFIGKDRGIER